MTLHAQGSGDEFPGDAKQRRDAADEDEQRHAVVEGGALVGTPDEPTRSSRAQATRCRVSALSDDVATSNWMAKLLT
jgi:hypothetical protein